MKGASVGGDQPLIVHPQTAEMSKPRERAFAHPPPAIPPQFPAVLMCCSLEAYAVRGYSG